MMLAAHQPLLANRITTALAAKPDGILEVVASQCGASLLEVLRQLPKGNMKLLPGLTAWGDVLMVIHTPDIVLECTGSLPGGTRGHGYFIIHGNSPIGGHIKASNCAMIALVDRPFHGRRSCSVQFLNREGNAMFKIFVRRTAERELDPAPLAMFELMLGRIASDGPSP